MEATREWPGRADRLEKSANRITLFRDGNKDGKPEFRETFVTGLNIVPAGG
ncbi:Membrane bound L-sorbosone dehydrogenase [compost metagenome]